MTVLRRRANPLVYPVVAQPRFDPTHIAGNGTRFSAVSSGINFINLMSGKGGTVTSASSFPAPSVQHVTGPATQFNTSALATDSVVFTGQSTANDSAFTLACIFVPNTIALTNAHLFTTGSAGTSGTPSLRLVSGVPGLLYNGGTSYPFSSPTVTVAVGIPYFFIASTSGNSGTLNLFLKRLDTGGINTKVQTTSSTSSASAGSYSIGTRVSSSLVSGCSISAVMFSSQFSSMDVIRQWASDPWAYWYPRGFDLSESMVGVAAGSSFLAAWAANTNLPVLGTGTY